MVFLDLLQRRPLRPLLFRTLILNQCIAVPVALAMSAVEGDFFRHLLVVSLYSHLIGMLCMLASLVMVRRLDALPAGRKLVAVAALYFATGLIGAEIARRLALILFPWTARGNGVFASAAVGATVSLIVGIVLITVRHLRAQVAANELAALQARINPHFLFNTLNSIAALIREDPARAETVTLQLSSLFRYTLQAGKQDLVTLADEMAIVHGYLDIERVRLEDRLSVDVTIDPDLMDVRLPPLVLQPLVENAIKHGVASSVRGGEVRIRGWREDGMVHLTVTDTGGGAASETGTGEGLQNVRRRLQGTFGADASVHLSSSGRGTEARVMFRPIQGARAAQ